MPLAHYEEPIKVKEYFFNVLDNIDYKDRFDILPEAMNDKTALQTQIENLQLHGVLNIDNYEQKIINKIFIFEIKNKTIFNLVKRIYVILIYSYCEFICNNSLNNINNFIAINRTLTQKIKKHSGKSMCVLYKNKKQLFVAMNKLIKNGFKREDSTYSVDLENGILRLKPLNEKIVNIETIENSCEFDDLFEETKKIYENDKRHFYNNLDTWEISQKSIDLVSNDRKDYLEMLDMIKLLKSSAGTLNRI